MLSHAKARKRKPIVIQPHCISASEFKRLVQTGKKIDLIDVRTEIEFREVHIEVARNEPLDRIDPQEIQAARNTSASEPLYIVCRSGSRGKQACEKFMAAGFANVINVEGGTMACEAAGLTVVRGKKMMSLERQVRIAAGLLVATGSVLGYFVHPYWIGLAGFIGAGLVFAGITDTCAMGMMIAKMPWNQVAPSSCTK